jgi:hypothetical protein
MYKNIYPHIDLKVYGNEKQIEYDWIVSPGGNPCDIRFEFKDVKGTELDSKGNIIITTEFGKIIHKRPSAYQRRNNKIDIRFKKLSKNSYTFNVGKYNKTEKLIIDPLVLLYSTYLGGRLYDKGNGIAVDSSGCAYVTGYTESKDFPLQNPYQANSNSPSWRHDAFITKLNSTGDGLIYSTYIGGNKNDRGVAIAVDANECAYITGYTDSSDFPLQNPYMNYKKYNDVFVTKLSTDGQSLIYSTYLGGDSYDFGYGIAVDANECAYITGDTISKNFPLKNPYQANTNNPMYQYDVFITKLNSTGDGLIYSTYLGGSYQDGGTSIAVDSSGCAYVTGDTYSSDFPLKNSYMSHPGDFNCDAFITKLSADGQSLVYSTYLGGSDTDWAYGIAVDANECAYVTGCTRSTDFPLQDPYMTDSGDDHWDVFVTKFSTDGQSLIYSTYLGGWSGDCGYGIAVDSSECAYVTGYTRSSDFPLQNPYQANYQESCDVFITKLNPTGDGLIYSTYLGGECHDEGNGIAVDSSGSAYVTGTTSSLDFPLQNPYQANSQIWKFDAFITKLNLKDLIVRASVSGGNGSATPSKQSIAYGSNASITITPALGYEIASITDNGVSQTIINPYIIENVTEDHLVIVSFKLSIKLSMTGVKKTERAWIIKRDYGELNILVTNPWGIEYTYIIQRSENGGGFQDIKTLSSSEIGGGTYTYYDKYLGKNIVYTYRFIAKDSSGNIIALSNEISI